MTSFSCSLFAAAATFVSSADLGDVRLKGYVGARLDAMFENHVCATDVGYITAPFLEKTERTRRWQTEFWGKYMHSAAPLVGYTGSAKLAAAVDFGVDRILASQEPSGYIGNYPDELRCGEGWDVWGMKYTMMGLLHYHDLMRLAETSRPVGREAAGRRAARALDACRRLCDYVIGEIGPNGKRGRELWQTGSWSGLPSSSILEPVVWLYRRTRERRYLDFATYIVRGMTEPEKGPRLVDLALKGISVADRNGHGNVPEQNGQYVHKTNRSKAYETMSCYQGLLDYWEETGRSDLREAAFAAAEQIRRDEINLAGGCSSAELWFHGATKQHRPGFRLQETCVTTTWLRLCEKLLAISDDPKWADEIERTFYNVYLAAMKADGSAFSAYVPLSGDRSLGHDHCYMHTDCCTANGPRGALVFLRQFFRDDGRTATFNFYGSARVKGFDMYSLYPRGGSVRITSHLAEARALRLRIPAWCPKAVVKVNGAEAPGAKAGAYFTVERTWALGDVVELSFEMPVVAHRLDHAVAFTCGPILLARDSRFGDGALDEPFRPWYEAKEGQRVDGFRPVRVPTEAMWMAFSATLPLGAHFENLEARNPVTVGFCDYASAGDTWRRTDHYRTWLPVEYWPTDD